MCEVMFRHCKQLFRYDFLTRDDIMGKPWRTVVLNDCLGMYDCPLGAKYLNPKQRGEFRWIDGLKGAKDGDRDIFWACTAGHWGQSSSPTKRCLVGQWPTPDPRDIASLCRIQRT
uniref:Uncharacterized protein n=1 Tax=Hucho hucho TaxID=62062 RepID=A0A4W5RR89_9TELE